MVPALAPGQRRRELRQWRALLLPADPPSGRNVLMRVPVAVAASAASTGRRVPMLLAHGGALMRLGGAATKALLPRSRVESV